MALWALDFLLLTTVVTVDVEEGWLSTIYAINVERLTATGASLVFSADFCTASRTANEYRRFFAAEWTGLDPLA